MFWLSGVGRGGMGWGVMGYRMECGEWLRVIMSGV